MRAYLAGPMRGYPRWNFDAFYAAARDLRERGWEIVSPAEHDVAQGFDPSSDSLDGFDLRAAFLWDVQQVIAADAVIVLPGWERSTGATAEVAVARVFSTPIYAYDVDDRDQVRLLCDDESVTLEANRLVHGARQSSYGHPHDDFSRTGRLWGAILGIDPVPPALVGLCMAAVKISREVNKPSRDNLVDLAGYAETVNLVRRREAEAAR